MNELTPFQLAILGFLETAPNRMASTWTIGAGVFPERWARARSRGAMVVHIRNAGYAMVKAGLLGAVLPPRDEHGAHWLCDPKTVKNQVQM
ncbi:hypothetical protein ACEN2T_18005 [Pseudomonas sp. W22_MBD1_FP4]|uniref:hypothetical protein n=1 Tax=Pseudomonas sp. W22_MBD1_FP4 TaxID=3240272 RepID=UPI003F9D97B0